MVVLLEDLELILEEFYLQEGSVVQALEALFLPLGLFQQLLKPQDLLLEDENEGPMNQYVFKMISMCLDIIILNQFNYIII